jgi:predicted 3-demethylubiquinone-9 3-methyltransferase (glyoxalase superfamily)
MTITPFLWYDGQAEEAAKFYVSIFSRSKLGTITRWGEGGPAPAGSVMTVSFEVEGQPLLAFNGGPEFKFTPAISLSVSCETQAQIDALWEQLARGGRIDRCGWLQDRFGVSWQIVPERIGELVRHPRAMQAMLKMIKLDIAALEAAAREG